MHDDGFCDPKLSQLFCQYLFIKIFTMKSSVVIALGLVATTQGFAPVSQGRVNTDLSATFFDTIFGMDLFAPKKDQNEYGARNKKNVSDACFRSGL
jgi:hypothetical protein